jgi:ArsR family transcriptional regulator, cadmium/lead-responsive transcriptional repressor
VQSALFCLPATPASTELVANSFRALGDPTRRRILGLLPAEGELAAGEVTRQLGQPQPTVFNHLACLRWCGLVTTRCQHRVVHYRPADPRVAATLDLAQGLLDDPVDQVAACCRIPEA